MLINVAQLLKENIGSSRTIQINEPVTNKDIKHIEGNLYLLRTKFGILVEGKLSASVSSICNRCLSPFDHCVSFNFSEEFLQSISILNDSLLGNSPDQFTIDRNHNIDMYDAIAQYISLAIPIKLICRPDCAGICLYCGQNLNQSHCTCKIKSSGQYKIKSGH